MGGKFSTPKNILSNMVKNMKEKVAPPKPSAVVKKPGSIFLNESFLSIPNNNINLLNKNFTIEFWVKTMESNNGWIFNNGSIGIGFEASRLKYLWNGQKLRLAPDSAPVIGNWVFVRMCFDMSRNVLTFFINNTTTSVSLQSALNMEPSSPLIIGNNTETVGFVGKITDFRITFDILCSSMNSPTNKLTVSDKTALLISPIDTNPFVDLTNKNKIENVVGRYDSDYPLNIEGFSDTYSMKNKKIFGYLLIMLIIIIVLIMSYCNNNNDLSSTSSGVFQKPEYRGFF